MLQDLGASLSVGEKARADRFHYPVDRDRFVAARGWLRVLLAGPLSCAPEEVEIVTGDHGKPRLAHSRLRFNASRSAGIALYATSWTTEVGVDIEAIRSDVDMDEIAALFFTTEEQRALAPLSPDHRLLASFQCWTRKEAYLKGLGVGVTGLPLRDVEVGVGVSAATVPPAIVAGWSIHQVDVAPGFAAAVAASSLGGWAPATPRLSAATAADILQHPAIGGIAPGTFIRTTRRGGGENT